jgi:hypothetical protein
MILAYVLIAQLDGAFFKQMIFAEGEANIALNERNINVALALQDLTTSEASIGVFSAGTVSYYSERESIDFLGKSEAYIANLPPDLSGSVAWNGLRNIPGHIKYDLYYAIQELRPTYIQDCYWGTQNICGWVDQHYIKVDYGGVSLLLDRDAEAVDWEKAGVEPPPSETP